MTIRNKYIILAAGFWLGGIILLLIGSMLKSQSWAGTLFTIGILGQAVGFGLFGFAIMKGAFNKKE
ncbi:hypothetical protein BN8_06328 [Fibrisoma limi BUZ 3]|uniref:Uncharacterized protein n=1 Tax=Fibrisoma limi BUZ 3 TaxID=1185876 RepID=I2GSQ9_9BACT|nr:hypothetical protein [Fibrisoma limi]CCH56938.1 hypothetical protein BN8_06328 [Fibrisoma limi BUZ 3]